MSGILTGVGRARSGSATVRRVVEGVRLPDDRSLTPNERLWVETLRAIVGDADPPPSLPVVQAVRRVLTGR